MMAKHRDDTRVEICPLECDRPWDQEEGRYCPVCEDYSSTCWNDHCSECGAST